MSHYLYRLARWCVRKRWAVVAAWIVIAILTAVVSQVSGGKQDNNLTIPGTEADQAAQVLAAKLPMLSGASTQVVFATPNADISQARYAAGIESTVANLKKVGQVAAVSDPFTAKSVAPDGHVALASVQFSVGQADVTKDNASALDTAAAPARAAGVQVEFSGNVYPGSGVAESTTPELIGIIVAFVILLITFGAFAAAFLPILTAILGVITTMMALTAMAAVVSIASASTTVALMLGLSCGIDYGLFIVSRHRANLLSGMSIEESAGRAAGTAGGSVVFAALTVVVALCGLAVPGIPFLTTMGLAAAGSVLIALLISLTFLPAAIAIAGKGLTKFMTKRFHEKPARAAIADPEGTTGARWARFVVRFRAPVLIGGVLLLGVLAIPALSMNLGLPGAGSKPTSDTSRRAYDLTTEHFGAGFNGTLLVIADGVTDPAQAAPMTATLSGLPGVVSAKTAMVASGVAVINVTPKTGPDDPATADLVHRIRDDRGAIAGNTGAKVLVGGLTASDIDVSSKLGSALPIFLLVVIALALILLTFAFRTILVPIKSIVGFLLSVCASFGAVVAFFQWGWGEKLLGITPGPIVSFLPIILLAIIFGLSSDYEVFVVSRIKEDFTKTGDARGAVLRGTGQSTRVVSAAALIMVAIFVAFLGSSDPTIKSIGFSFAVGVFIDAFVVRLTLVPALMAIVGARMWYHPRWFERRVPDPDIEGHRLDQILAEHERVEEQSASTPSPAHTV